MIEIPAYRLPQAFFDPRASASNLPDDARLQDAIAPGCHHAPLSSRHSGHSEVAAQNNSLAHLIKDRPSDGTIDRILGSSLLDIAQSF